MNKLGCLIIVIAIIVGLVYADVISVDMLLGWCETVLTWLINAFTSLLNYLQTL